jgi:hypothetical protein
MEQHVRRKLTSIVDRLEGRRRIGRHTDTFYYNVYSYGHEIALGLTAVGLSHPLVELLSPDTSQANAAVASNTLFASIAQYPAWLLVIVGVAFAFWLLTRINVNHRKLTEKVPLYRACSRELGKAESDLDAALNSASPLTALSDLQIRVKDIVDKYYAADGWPWPISPPNTDAEVERRINALCAKYKQNWEALPAGMQQSEPAQVA